MRKNLSVLAGLLFVLGTCASPVKAQYYDSLTAAAFAHLDRKEYEQAFKLGKEVHQTFPDDLKANILCAFSLINLGRAAEAGPYVGTGLKLDPTDFSIHLDAAYYFAATGNAESARAYLTESIRLLPEEHDLNKIQEELRTTGVNAGNPALFNELASWYGAEYRKEHTRYPTSREMYKRYDSLIHHGAADLKKAASEMGDRFAALGWHEMVLYVYSTASYYLMQHGFVTDAIETAQTSYTYYNEHGSRENYELTSMMYLQLVDAFGAAGNDERAAQFLDEILALTGKTSLQAFNIRSLTLLSGSFSRLHKISESRSCAAEAYRLAEAANARFALASAANAVCLAYTYKIDEQDVNTSIAYGEFALKLALTARFDALVTAIAGNLAVSYWKSGVQGQAKCMQLYGALVKMHTGRNELASAALALNNAGALFFMNENFEVASKLFEESIALGRKRTESLSSGDKLSFYQSQISAHEFLTVCYAKLNNPQKVFEMMEGSRSRVLGERLSGSGSPPAATLSELQASLKPDEACLMYSLFSGHEVTILVVTSKYAHVHFNSDNDFIGKIKDKYLDRINKEHSGRKGIEKHEVYDRDMRVQMSDFQKVTQLTRKFFENPGMADDVLQEYLKGYYRFLILPVANRLSTVKKLYISPDNVLNFIPFEALTFHDGKYLIEKFDVQYFHSVGIRKLLESRTYGARKPVLAMGGATFNNMDVKSDPVQTQQALNRLQAETEARHREKRSQRRAYAALFGTQAMNYLPGTVEEVRNIQKVVPAAVVFVGHDMTENRIKEMSVSGELAKYRILHLATHGFVVNEIPLLSGVATSIFPQEVNGEDGFLNTSEIAELKLNADLTILSACQTALGKIYSGEGVTGLTQSVIVAGSNAAIVSLWPVNDNSTMLFMTDFYKEVQAGKPYPAIVNELKRKFIKGAYGDEFRHPNFWAPFIYTGK